MNEKTLQLREICTNYFLEKINRRKAISFFRAMCLLIGVSTSFEFFGEIEKTSKNLLSFFSVKLQSEGVWGAGLASERADLNQVPLGEASWTLRNDRTFYSQRKCVFLQ